MIPQNYTGPAIWRTKDVDQPLEITGYLGEENGRHYFATDNGQGGIPGDEIHLDQDFSDFGLEVHYWQNGHVVSGIVTEKKSDHFWRIDGALIPVASIISETELETIKRATDDITDSNNTTRRRRAPQKKQQNSPPPSNANFLLTESPDDEGNAQCLNQLYTGKFLQCDALGWLFYNSKYWQHESAEDRLDRAVIDTLKQRRIQAVVADNEKLVKATKPTAANVRNCKYLFKSLSPAAVHSFDNDPDRLNCKNGVVNLKTGDITPHDPAQRFTYCLPVAYNPTADDSPWVDWLYNAITPEDFTGDNKIYTDLLTWLQMAVGYSLTGRTNEQCLFFLQGPTRGGKGLFTQTLAKMTGKMGHAVDFDAFTAKRGGDSQNFDLAPLKAARLVIASESSRANMLNSKTVKAITGNDAVYCAFKHRDHFEYTPQFKIWLTSNFNVMGDANDDALWARLRVITFPNSFLNREDFTLADKLHTNLEGVLAWAVAGAIEWYKCLDRGQGLGRPDIITQVTQIHRNENDTVQQFIDECCTVASDRYAPGATFSHQYIEWCKQNNISPLGGRRLGESMRRKGFDYGLKRVDGHNVTKVWSGIGLNL